MSGPQTDLQRPNTTNKENTMTTDTTALDDSDTMHEPLPAGYCAHQLQLGEVWTCEAHPGHLWSGAHPQECGGFKVCAAGCPGPGMPLSASLALLH